MGFPQKLQEYRQREKLSQEGLAARLGVSRQSVSKWEQGLSFPETEKLIELSSMMGVTIDSLLKDDTQAPPPEEPAAPPETPPAPAEPEQPQPPAQEPSAGKRWEKWLAIGLIVLLAAVAIWQLSRKSASDPYESLWTTETAPETTLPAQTEPEPQPTTTPIETEPVETEPPETEPGFDTENLRDIQDWFFDFAVDYRLDYMPQFTQEEGPTKDSGEYLDWAFAINLDNWGEDKGKMSRDYVEETVLMYFSVIPEQHRSHIKSWDYDADSQIYTAYPGSLKDLSYYLLNSIEISAGTYGASVYTVHATRYDSHYRTDSLDENLILALTEGNPAELTPVSEITLTFTLDHVFHRPVFQAFTEEFLTDTVS